MTFVQFFKRWLQQQTDKTGLNTISGKAKRLDLFKSAQVPDKSPHVPQDFAGAVRKHGAPIQN